MKVKYSNDPKAWRNSTLLSAAGLLFLCSLLRWRHLMTQGAWAGTLVGLVGVASVAWFRPQHFRAYYRFSTWAGFWSSQCVARIVLALIFVVVVVPAGLVLRLFGKDPLHLKRSPDATSYWKPTKKSGSLDRLF